MNLPILQNKNLRGKRVLLRADVDVPLRQAFEAVSPQAESAQGKLADFRLKSLQETINYLTENGAKTIIVGHRGRPGGVISKELSLYPIAKRLEKIIDAPIKFIYGITEQEAIDEANNLENGKLTMMENLRFGKGEEENDPEFAKRLAQLGDFYINESFADSHREHASIVGLPKLLPHAAGFRFIKEVEVLSNVVDNPRRPLVVIVGGGKTDKSQYVDVLLDHADWVLVGGILPRLISSYCRSADSKACVVAAVLEPSGDDIDDISAGNFAAIVANAGTVVWNGPLGRYEEEKFRGGTEVVAHAIAKNRDAFRVVGGGDTITALTMLGILDTMDWVSTGGGAMLEFLASGTLPGIEVLKHDG